MTQVCSPKFATNSNDHYRGGVFSGAAFIMLQEICRKV